MSLKSAWKLPQMIFGSKWWLKFSRRQAFVLTLRTNTATTSSRSRWWSASNHSSLSLLQSLSLSCSNWQSQVTLATKFTKRYWSSMVKNCKWIVSMPQSKRQKRRRGKRSKTRSLSKLLPKLQTLTSTSMPTSLCPRCPNKPQCKGWWTHGSKYKQVSPPSNNDEWSTNHTCSIIIIIITINSNPIITSFSMCVCLILMSRPDPRYLGRPYSTYTATTSDCYTTAQTRQRWTRAAVCSDTIARSASQTPLNLSLTWTAAAKCTGAPSRWLPLPARP